MTKGMVISVALNVLVTTLLLQQVNAGTIKVYSSSSSSSSFSSTNCDGMACSGQSCSVSISTNEDSSTWIRSCTGSTGKSRRETIVTTVVRNQECITNTTDVDGKITTTKKCSQLSPQELKIRHKEWENKMNMITAEEEKLNNLLESEERAWEKQKEAQEDAWKRQEEEMERAFQEHEKAMEQSMLQREKMWKMQEEAMSRKLETLADFEM